jgi:hypothetical protein
MSLPLTKRAPARTSATRWGALTIRHRVWCLDQLERHGHACGAGAGTLGDPGSEPDRGEGRLDRFRGPRVDPVLGWVVVEGEQHVEVVGDLRGGLRPLDAELGGERLRGGSGVGLVLGVVDLRERGSRGRRGRHRSQSGW